MAVKFNKAVLLTALGLATIVGVGVWLRVQSIDESLWLDELHTSWVVADDLADAAPRARLGNQHPLYFYAPFATTRLLGESEASLRAPSVVAGVLLIIGAFSLVQVATKVPLAALAAAWCVAVDFDAVWYSQEARGYALVQLVALLQLFAGWRMSFAPSGWIRAAVVALSALLFYLHYTTALFLAAETLVFVAAKCLAKERFVYRWSSLAIDAGIVALLCAPCLSQLREIAAARGNWLSVVPRRTLLDALTLFPLAPLGAAAAALALVIAARRFRSTKSEARPLRDRLLLALAPLAIYAIVVAAAWIARETLSTPLLLKRYLIAIAILPALSTGSMLATIPSAFARALALLVVVAIAAQGQTLRPWAAEEDLGRHNEDWRAAVAFLNISKRHGSPVLVRSGFIEADERHASPLAIEREYCLAPVRGAYRLDPPQEVYPVGSSSPLRPSDEAIESFRRFRRGWLITRSATKDALAQADSIVTLLNRPQVQWGIRGEHSFGKVTVVYIKRLEDFGQSEEGFADRPLP